MKNFKYFILLGFTLMYLSCTRNYKADKARHSSMYDTVYKISDNKYEEYTFKDSKRHGVMHLYDIKNGIIEERLYLYNKLMLVEDFGGDLTTFGYTYLYNDCDTLYPIGSIAYDIKTDQKIQKMCTYFEVEAPDTITYGEQYKVKIKGNYGLFERFKISLILGEVNSDFTLKNQQKELHSDNNKIEFTIQNYDIGINLLTGHVRYFENDTDVTTDFRITDKQFPLVFYKQFVVIQPSK